MTAIDWEKVNQLIRSVIPQDKEEKARVRAAFNEAKGFFGTHLDHECPIVVCDCIAYLRNRGFYEVGVFRIPGNQDVVNSLKTEYNSKFDTKLAKEESGYRVLNYFKPAPSVNDVASLLKAFFTDLQEPLMPKEASKAMIDINNMNLPQEEETRAFSKIMKRIKSPNRECLSFLISFLRELCAFRKFNNMTADNLSTCFVLSIMGKGDASMQIMLVGSGTKVLKKLISSDVKVFMPSVNHVKRNTRYKDVSDDGKGKKKTPPKQGALPQDPDSGVIAQDLSRPGGGAPMPGRTPRAFMVPLANENRYDGLPAAPMPTAGYSGYEDELPPPPPERKRANPPKPKRRNDNYGAHADDLFGGLPPEQPDVNHRQRMPHQEYF